jgi:hypothetical protein
MWRNFFIAIIFWGGKKRKRGAATRDSLVLVKEPVALMEIQ